jgi:hypothetical protein
MEHHNFGRVEDLLSRIANIRGDQATFDLWVPQNLSLNGHPVTLDVAMAIALDAMLEKGFFPDGFDRGENGRHYKYRLEP